MSMKIFDSILSIMAFALLTFPVTGILVIVANLLYDLHMNPVP
jgi:hypothetical protein